MIKRLLFTFAALIGMFFAFSQIAESRPSNICLGWTGGAAGDGVIWSDGIITEMGDKTVITYTTKGGKKGTMTGKLNDEGGLVGTWEQAGAKGGFKFSTPEEGEAEGLWWKGNKSDTTYAMKIYVGECK